ncbi:hypothetical protein [Streptomyces sp. NPDC052179]|uniref:hypothetical protein n=1 Tax=Streptomyces sp. NPDC052179 TaxID=3155680 RepID=UPI00342BB06F
MPSAPPASPPPARAVLRAERRRLREAIRAKRSLLKGRRAFERADARRVFQESAARDTAVRAHTAVRERAANERQRTEQLVAGRLRALDDDRQNSEARELQLLRSAYIDAALRRAPLNVKELNGLGAGLINDLAVRGVRTAADFTHTSRGTAPNGKGGEVIWIHLAGGAKVRVNGIGEHRAKALVQWRQSHLRRAEERAPKRITAADRRRVEELAARRRAELTAMSAAAGVTADQACAEADRHRAQTLARLADAARGADAEARARRARYDALAEELLRLEAELDALDATHGGLGARLRRTGPGARRTDPLAPIPRQRARSAPHDGTTARTAPGITPPGVPWAPAPASAPAPTPTPAPAPASVPGPAPASAPASAPGSPAAGPPPGKLWLVPVVFFLGSALTGTPELPGAPLWITLALRLGHLMVGGSVLGIWLHRRRRFRDEGTAPVMPGGAKWALALWLLAAVLTMTRYD